MENDPAVESRGRRAASELSAAENIEGDDEQDTLLLRTMSGEARRYISSFPWCGRIQSSYFGGGVGGLFAVFLFHIRPSRPGVEPWIWIVVGDIPPAYLPISDCTTPREVFRTYIRGMKKWVELARTRRTGSPEDGVPPVDVPATPEWAERLDQRLAGLMLAVKPMFENESGRIN
jgi:hypothetical protein